MVDKHAPVAVWRSLRTLPHFRRLLELRLANRFGDGSFQVALAGALLFDPERAATPWEVAGAFAVLLVPYSMLGPFAGAVLDRWDRRLVLVGANLCRLVLVLVIGVLLAVGAGGLPILFGALIINGCTRFVSAGLSAALPHVVPREQVVTMNSVTLAGGAVATFVGANFMLLPRLLIGAGDASSAALIFVVAAPMGLALVLALRFPPRVLGPDDTAAAVHGSVFYVVSTGWVHGARTVLTVPSVTATLAGLLAHSAVFGINSLLMLVLVRHTDAATMAVAGLGTAAAFVAATGIGSFLATVATPAALRRWGRYATANGALLAAALIQLGAVSLRLPVLVACGFLLGAAGQVVKLCVDSAMQLDVDDPMRGHVFAVQDALFWVAFVATMALAAALVPADGRSPALIVTGAMIYAIGFAMHLLLGRRRQPVSSPD